MPRTAETVYSIANTAAASLSEQQRLAVRTTGYGQVMRCPDRTLDALMAKSIVGPGGRFTAHGAYVKDVLDGHVTPRES